MLDPSLAYVWSFPPNWKTPFSVTKEYKTDIFVSRSRRESRRALRSTPRRQFDFQPTIDGADMREFNALMATAQDKPFIMPDWSRRVRLSDDTLSGSDTLTFDTVPSWIVPERALFLSRGSERPTPVFVAGVGSSTVTLVGPVDADWLSGTSVLPGSVGLLADEMRLSSPTNTVDVAAVSFNVEPVSEPVDVPPVAAVTFNNREVCLLRPNWGAGIDHTLMWPNETVDFGRGVIAPYFPFDSPSRLRRASFISATVDESQDIEDFLDRMKGQRGEFYMPTGENDLPPIVNLGSGASTLTVAGTLVGECYSDSAVYKAICVVKRDGTRLYRTVTGIVTSSGNSVLTVSSPWPSTITPSSVLMISWMPVWRLGSDSLTISWVTDQVSQCDLTLRMLDDLSAETF